MQKRRSLLLDDGTNRLPVYTDRGKSISGHLRAKYKKLDIIQRVIRCLIMSLIAFSVPLTLIHYLSTSPFWKADTVSFRVQPFNESTVISSFTQGIEIKSLRMIDREQYTIRIMTFRRNDQLLISLNHHSSCPGVALIQVVWCDQAYFPPPDILYHKSSKVVVEFHSTNSLNERFNILTRDEAWNGWSTHPKKPDDVQAFHFVETPTLGILSIDDDVMRPCEAIDAGFFRWTHHPDRMVGFDARVHSISRTNDESHKEVWTYGYLSQVRKKNHYSLTLSRFCFLHRDYLHMYMTTLHKTIFAFVEEKMNCEDIAMSLFVSSKTQGKLPLLADLWAMEAMVKLKSTQKISDSSNHKSTRDFCVNSFAEILGLKGTNISFQPETIVDSKTRNWFGVGVDRDEWTISEDSQLRKRQLYNLLQSWEKEKIIRKKVAELMKGTVQEALQKGLLDE